MFRHERKEADLLRSLNQAEVCASIFIVNGKVSFFFLLFSLLRMRIALLRWTKKMKRQHFLELLALRLL